MADYTEPWQILEKSRNIARVVFSLTSLFFFVPGLILFAAAVLGMDVHNDLHLRLVHAVEKPYGHKW
jgi:hypothetical protein